MESKVLNIGGVTYRFSIETFDEDIDIDALLKIDYSNLIGEICTFPLIVNRFGILLAECESKVTEAKMNTEIFEAKLKERLRISLAEENNGKMPTVDMLNTAIALDKGYQAVQRTLMTAKKNRDYILTIYLAAKDKSEKLNKLSMSIQPGDISDKLLEGRINGIVIRKSNRNLID